MKTWEKISERPSAAAAQSNQIVIGDEANNQRYKEWNIQKANGTALLHYRPIISHLDCAVVLFNGTNFSYPQNSIQS